MVRAELREAPAAESAAPPSEGPKVELDDRAAESAVARASRMPASMEPTSADRFAPVASAELPVSVHRRRVMPSARAEAQAADARAERGLQDARLTAEARLGAQMARPADEGPPPAVSTPAEPRWTVRLEPAAPDEAGPQTGAARCPAADVAPPPAGLLDVTAKAVAQLRVLRPDRPGRPERREPPAGSRYRPEG